MLQAPVLLQILEKMRDDHHPFYPQVLRCSLVVAVYFVCESLSLFALCKVLMVDGNGILHPRGISNTQAFFCCISNSLIHGEICVEGFGLACHLGVLAHLPTIGVGKNVLSLKPFLLVYIILSLSVLLLPTFGFNS